MATKILIFSIDLQDFDFLQLPWVSNLYISWNLLLPMHSGRDGHNNETLILQNFAFNMQSYTYLNPYDMN